MQQILRGYSKISSRKWHRWRQRADRRMRISSSTSCNQRVSRTVGEMCYHYQTQRRNDFIMYRYMLVLILKRRVGISQSVVRRTTGLDGTDSIPGSVRFMSSPQRPTRFWGTPSPLSNGYRGLYPRDKAPRAWIWPLTSI
jgi:hypothetical protein